MFFKVPPKCKANESILSRIFDNIMMIGVWIPGFPVIDSSSSRRNIMGKTRRRKSRPRHGKICHGIHVVAGGRILGCLTEQSSRNNRSIHGRRRRIRMKVWIPCARGKIRLLSQSIRMRSHLVGCYGFDGKKWHSIKVGFFIGIAALARTGSLDLDAINTMRQKVLGAKEKLVVMSALVRSYEGSTKQKPK